jgi:DNA modification methylase
MKAADFGVKPKDLIGIPWLVAFALRADGWYLRSHMPWIKRNAMPESATDRPGQSVESMFLLSKSEYYYFDMEAVRVPFADARNGCDGSSKKSERNRGGRTDGFTKPNGVDPSKNGGRNFRNHDLFMRSWNGMLLGDADETLAFVVNPKPFKGAHFAVFPPALVEPCIKAGSAIGNTVLDPFSGAGTTALVCQRLDREFIGIELNPEYIEMAENRIVEDMLK